MYQVKKGSEEKFRQAIDPVVSTALSRLELGISRTKSLSDPLEQLVAIDLLLNGLFPIQAQNLADAAGDLLDDDRVFYLAEHVGLVPNAKELISEYKEEMGTSVEDDA